MRLQQRLTKAHLGSGSQYQAQYQRRHGVVQLSGKIADRAKEQH